MKRLILLAVLMATQTTLQAENAETLHSQACMGCHGTDLYTREDRKVEFLADLEMRVERCNIGTQAGWTGEQIDEVTDYLNNNFYHFD